MGNQQVRTVIVISVKDTGKHGMISDTGLFAEMMDNLALYSRVFSEHELLCVASGRDVEHCV